jgi:hypothetical protein
VRAIGRDIVELFGYASDDTSPTAQSFSSARKCPISHLACSKTNHDQSEIYGSCTVSHGSLNTPGSEIIICPTRLYADNYFVFSNIVADVWGANARTLVVGGSLPELAAKARNHIKCVVAFGQRSGGEIQVDSFGKMSMDWVLQAYDMNPEKGLVPVDFVGVEVQSLDITGNYRDNWQYYMKNRQTPSNSAPPNSEHGLNWANVHKRLLPQLVRKGNIYSKSRRCRGTYFILPDSVFRKFSEVLGPLPTQSKLGSDNLSVMTYVLGPNTTQGQMRSLVPKSTFHYSFSDVKNAVTNYTDPLAPLNLDEQLLKLL